MSIEKPLKKIVKHWVSHIEERIDQLGCSVGSIGLESPIEELLFIAIHTHAEQKAVDYSFQSVRGLRKGSPPEQLRHEDGKGSFNIAIQPAIAPYRVDFLVSIFCRHDGKWHDLVVECDGHDFHERTKEQAAKDRSRDRELQQRGFTVYRFTGSEIYRDPVRCSEQVIDWAFRILNKDIIEEMSA